MKTYHESDIRRRVLVAGFVCAAWFAVLLLRLVQLQVFNHAAYKEIVVTQNSEEKTVRPRRGNIYDRNGRVLASSVPVFSIAVWPLRDETAAGLQARLGRLKPVLGLSQRETAEALKRLVAARRYTYLRKGVSEETAEAVRKLKLPGTEIEPAHKRSYPLKTLAAHLLGGVDADENGRTGVEAAYDMPLRGQEGKQIVSIDSKRREYQTRVIEAPVPGRDLVLTIDATIQYIAERELARAVAEHSASWGSIVICEPETGEILAMANFPTFDVNGAPDRADAWTNRAIQSSYEPGSTFKIVTAAAALETHRVAFSDVFDCRAGSITLGGLTIRDHTGMGVLSFPEVIIESSNVGTVKFATRMPQADFYAAILKFGMGARTGIDLPFEDRGKVRPLEIWNKRSSLPHIAIGYEMRATPLQILLAMNVYATRGLLVHPYVVRESVGPDGPVAARPAPPARIISRLTADQMVTRALEKVVERGTGKEGRLEGFSVAGKTGTAQIYDRELGGYTSKYVASFVGFVPADRPAISMIVVLSEPKEGFYYGGQVCAPVFRDVARHVLRYLAVPPENPAAGRVVTASLGRGERP